jgi:hypothetical protein
MNTNLMLPQDPKQGLLSANAAPTDHLAQLQLMYSGRHKPVDLAHVLIECEIYAAGEENLTIHTACPKCRHMQKIESTNKKIDLQRDRQGNVIGLHVEPFTCPWEMTDEKDDRKEFGFGREDAPVLGRVRAGKPRVAPGT